MKFLFLIVFLLSCTFSGDQPLSGSAKDLEVNRSKIGTAMMNINPRIRAKLIFEEKYNDFSGFTSEEYLKKMVKYQIPSDKPYVDFMSSKDIEIVLMGKEKKFVICAKSIKQHLIFCDDAYSAELEFPSTNTDIDLNAKIKEYI